ncbi:Ketosteroid isomerase-related protein [Pseudoxanthomonas wuyuanensis]|uniref:Ketosteroid isomerase-related protein n=1 Tax=Pseudoxanthomonas wuyuanensis TaxID=1073196 RepID=A0A286CYX5_9GAMM|nr:hypothetical protein CSC75_19105 [Pseudoxanthomonas wuyuanensis]SOD51602.1 Ketosteroid isomerase-related protein [Pseudoxanthomonas wuyuanensis]
MTMPRRFTVVVTLAFATLISGLALAQNRDSTIERNRQFIAQAFEKWAAGSGTFFQDVLAPDVVWTIKGTSPAAGSYRGRDAFMEQAVAPFAARLSSPVRPTVKDIWADGNDVIVHWDGAATAADGAPYSNSYVWIFRMANLRATEVTAFLDLVPYDDVIRRIPIDQQGDTQMNQHPYVGMWVTDDGRIRHELLLNGRYDEARGTRESAYQGRYEVKGNHIDYWDDTGFTADGVFVDENTLHHGGMIFRRR